MRFQLVPSADFVDWTAIADHVQGVIREVDQAIAVGVFDVRFLDVPLPRDGPIEYLRARRDFVNL
jgi:hypothetical protein